jgi:hypothetical protein
MNRALVDKIVNVVLYEGYILYPYRASSKKNQRERFTFGRIYPRNYSDAQNGREPCLLQTECLICNESRDASLEVTVRFLQPLARETDGQTWLEALERKVKLPAISLNQPTKKERDFVFADAESSEGATKRRNHMVRGRIEVATSIVDPAVAKVCVRVFNETPMAAEEIEDQNEVLMRTFASTHTSLHAPGGKFISLLEPDPQYVDLAEECRNIGTWPVLVGEKEKGERDAMLSSPIILYDYPQIAAESSGDLFDNTEIDEILTLRVQTLSEREKLEMRRIDEHARKILERTESITPEQFLTMHGAMREVKKSTEEFFNPAKRLESARVHDVDLKKGNRVRIRPKKRADIMDMALDGKIGIIEAVEEDLEGQVHFALVLEDDPGRDLGMERHIGHRFFYSADEVEPVDSVIREKTKGRK